MQIYSVLFYVIEINSGQFTRYDLVDFWGTPLESVTLKICEISLNFQAKTSRQVFCLLFFLCLLLIKIVKPQLFTKVLMQFFLFLGDFIEISFH